MINVTKRKNKTCAARFGRLTPCILEPGHERIRPLHTNAIGQQWSGATIVYRPGVVGLNPGKGKAQHALLAVDFARRRMYRTAGELMCRPAYAVDTLRSRHGTPLTCRRCQTMVTELGAVEAEPNT